MTPTRNGRWQTRLLIFLTVGSVISAIFGALYGSFEGVFTVLGYLIAFGLVWDVVYSFVQSLRWDRDWSPALYLASAVWEAVFFWMFTRIAIRYGFPTPRGLPGIPPALGLVKFLVYYATMWVAYIVTISGPMRVLFPRWRYRGGQWL